MSFDNIDRKYQVYSVYSVYLGIAIFLVGSSIAILTYPGYNMSENYFSDTGLRIDYLSEDRGLIKSHPSPEIFNVTLYLLAIFLLPFTLLISTFFSREDDTKYLFKLSTIPGITITPALIGVGVWDFGNNFNLHLDAARLTMGSIGLFFLLWTLGVINLPATSKYKEFKSWKFDPIFAVLIMFFTYTQVVGIPNIPLIKEVPRQVYQKLVPYTTIPYLSFVAYRLKKIIDFQPSITK